MSTGITVGIGPRSALAFEQLTVSTASLGVSAGVIETFDATSKNRNQAIGATFTTEDASIRVTFDGTTPTADIGHLYPAGSAFEVWGIVNLKRMRMIREAGTDAVVTVTTWAE